MFVSCFAQARRSSRIQNACAKTSAGNDGHGLKCGSCSAAVGVNASDLWRNTFALPRECEIALLWLRQKIDSSSGSQPFIRGGSTYLGSRFAIESIPPFLNWLECILLAGVIMFGSRAQGAYKIELGRAGAYRCAGVSLLAGMAVLQFQNQYTTQDWRRGLWRCPVYIRDSRLADGNQA